MERESNGSGRWAVVKRIIWGVVGLALGGLFLWLALRNISPQDLASAVGQFRWPWLVAGVAIYMIAIGLRCVRWGVLLRASGTVRWRHAAETLVVGYAANYLLPARIGELFRVDYAQRLFHMSRFTSFGTIVVERVCDGVILVGALWISLGLVLSSEVRLMGNTSWMIATGAVASAMFGSALIFVVWSRRIDLRRFGVPESIANRWDQLTVGISSVMRSHTLTVIACTIGIWSLEVIALESVIRAFGIIFSLPQAVVLVGLGSLSTLIPTAPGYFGTYQFVFGQVFALFGHPESAGFVTSTAVQVFCFGGVTLLGICVLVSRSSLALWRGLRL